LGNLSLINTASLPSELSQNPFNLTQPLSKNLEQNDQNSIIPNTSSELHFSSQTFEKLKEMEKLIIENKTELINLRNEIIEKPQNHINNNLEIVCIGNNDNYLDMLTEKWGSFDKALEYIKNCALSDINGDCQLIEKIYFNQIDEKLVTNIYYFDKAQSTKHKAQTKIEYLNEKKEIIRESKESLGRKLANYLQNSYLKGINYLINQTLNNRSCPNKFLQEYDFQLWNEHI
jgi:hypothetical protein